MPRISKEELAKIVDAPQLPLDASRLALRTRINDQQKGLRYLLESLAHQGAAILELRAMQGAQAGAIEAIATHTGLETDTGSAIEMPVKPALIDATGRKLN
jgi:hypothetical protein